MLCHCSAFRNGKNCPSKYRNMVGVCNWADSATISKPHQVETDVQMKRNVCFGYIPFKLTFPSLLGVILHNQYIYIYIIYIYIHIFRDLEPSFFNIFFTVGRSPRRVFQIMNYTSKGRPWELWDAWSRHRLLEGIRFWSCHFPWKKLEGSMGFWQNSDWNTTSHAKKF